MCGIAGIISAGRPEARAARVAAMVSLLGHRGPDGVGAYDDEWASFGHTRLSILDLSEAGSQPMVAADCVLVFNGEIYNHLELRARLERDTPCRWQSHCDTETLLTGLRCWQEDVVRQLRGMFAFAMWNRTTRRLVGARDPFGKKPFYYWCEGGTFVFASSPEAVVCALDRRPDVDAGALSGYLLRGHFRPGGSVYRTIRTLPAGHLIEFDARTAAVTVRPFSQPRFALGDAGFDPFAVREGTAERLRVAIQRRLLSDVPVGVLLSGGVDSSLISLESPARLGAFCATFPGTDADESEYARQVADAGQLRLNQVEVRQPSFPVLLDRMVEAFREPFGDLSAIPAYSLFAGLKSHVTVALTGDGGDEVFAGYRDAALFWARHWLRPGALGNGAASAAARRLIQHRPGLARQVGLGLAALTLPGAELFLSLYREGWTQGWRRRLFRPEAWRSTGEAEIEAELSRAFYASGDTDLDRYLNMNLERLSECFLVKIDRTAMAHSIETRSPLLDVDLFDYAASLPVAALLPRGRPKAILKDLLAARMGRAFANRKKAGFTPPLAGWLRAPEAAAWVRGDLSDAGGYAAGLLAPQAIDELLRRHQAGEDHSARIWRLLMLNAWHGRSYDSHKVTRRDMLEETACGS